MLIVVAAPLNTFETGLTSREKEFQEIYEMNFRSLIMCIIELGDLGMLDEAQELLNDMTPPNGIWN